MLHDVWETVVAGVARTSTLAGLVSFDEGRKVDGCAVHYGGPEHPDAVRRVM
jgi:hypothetical protein